MKIGVTSQNFRDITPHAGMACRFMIFETASDNEIIQTGQLDLPKEMAMHGHPSDTAHPVDGVDVLITGSCGQGLARRLAARGIKVVVTSETDPITAVTALVSGAPLPPAPAEDGDHDACECHCSGGCH